jgi:hypothetical protein
MSLLLCFCNIIHVIPYRSLRGNIYYSLTLKYIWMKIKCPDCNDSAELSDDFSFVKCAKCSLEMTYGEYVRYIAHKDTRYRNILSDYNM